MSSTQLFLGLSLFFAKLPTSLETLESTVNVGRREGKRSTWTFRPAINSGATYPERVPSSSTKTREIPFMLSCSYGEGRSFYHPHPEGKLETGIQPTKDNLQS
ncbi:hypothetical protein AYL99_08507 [Fonsecaea erecta]|uniref:Secreted protein n=1 Tax=Fonsecaea erecta TaxID=1367422 RepID=A0A178ZDB4_9EURO|nr:hypothetical protein AYL99_08507 [Fonsecaea erecta]OAP57769.1 hypothetical protein AYL99_08507 [Fonsecaea erecta]